MNFSIEPTFGELKSSEVDETKDLEESNLLDFEMIGLHSFFSNDEDDDIDWDDIFVKK